MNNENKVILIIILMALFGFMTGWFVHSGLGDYQCKVALNKWGETKEYSFPLTDFNENMNKIHEENLVNPPIGEPLGGLVQELGAKDSMIIEPINLG